ncbi:MAG: hypothetical protein WC822_03060 [Candidatus Paceibacterota bacterium]|jgi:hypothetical protein
MNKITNKNKSISNRTRKGIFLILLIIFLVFVSANVVDASFSFGKFFGGKIISTKATEIQILEGSGYTCPMYGTSISIVPIGSPAGTPTSYYIPSYVTPMTRTTPMTGQQILGVYGGQTMISCFITYPPDIRVVSLTSIILFGTSRR